MFLGSLLISNSIPVIVRIVLTRRKHGRDSDEYRGLVTILICIYVYYVFFLIFMATMFTIYCAVAPEISPIFRTASPSLNPWYGGYFMALTSFSNCGFSLFTNSAMNFVVTPGWQVWACVFMLTGNVAFPLVFHTMFQAAHKVGLEKRLNAPISTILKHPREFFHLLFPGRYLAFLSLLWAFMFIVSFALCIGLEWNAGLAGLTDGQKVVASIFTAVTTRTTGLNVLNTGALSASFLVTQMVVFVVSSNPNAIVIKASSNKKGTKTVQEYTKELLINVVAGLTFCWVLILLLETGNSFVTPFGVIYEITSAFGTVGLSLGFGSSPTSLSGCFTIPSKLTIMILMSIGCHRSLPLTIDPPDLHHLDSIKMMDE